VRPLLFSFLLLVLGAQCFGNVAITTTTLPNPTVGIPYSAVIQASSGCTPYKWAIASGALPAGVTAKASSTTTSLDLIGTPTTAATDSFTVKVTGCSGYSSEKAYKVVVQSSTSGTLAITTTSLPNGTVGTTYSAVVKASGGCTPYKWAIASGALPAGVTATTASTTTSLNLSGTPTTAATDSFTVKVTACGGGTYDQAYKVAIQSSANHVVDLNWKASTTSDVTGYNVYRSPDASTWKRINVSLIASAQYSDSTVSNGSTYYYAATSVDIYGHESSKTAAIKVVVP
jgi:hypothetical protein